MTILPLARPPVDLNAFIGRKWLESLGSKIGEVAGLANLAFIVVESDPLAPNARTLAVNSSLTKTDSGVGSNITLAINLDHANIFTQDQSVPDEAYGAGWNGSLEVPTKNAVYDQIEALTTASTSPFIRKDGTTTTTASIPFALGLSVPANNVYSYIGDTSGVGQGRGYFRLQNSAPFTRRFHIGAEDTTTGISTSILIQAGGQTGATGSGGSFTFTAGVGGTSSGAGGSFTVNAGSGGSGGGQVRFVAGQALQAGNSGDIYFNAGLKDVGSVSGNAGSVFLTGGGNSVGGNYGTVYIGSGSPTPDKYSLTSSNAQYSLYINQALEVDGTTYLDGALNVVGTTTLATSLDGIITAAAGVIGELNGVQGDVVYYSGTNTLTVLNKNTSATRYLSNTGSSNNPAWAQVDLSTGVTGTLPASAIPDADDDATTKGVSTYVDNDFNATSGLVSINQAGTFSWTGLHTFNRSTGTQFAVNDGTSAAGWNTYASKFHAMAATSSATSVGFLNVAASGGIFIEERTSGNFLSTNAIGAGLPSGWAFEVGRSGSTIFKILESSGLATFSNDVALASNMKLYLEGSGSDTYIYFDSAAGEIKFYVNGVYAGGFK